MVDGAAETELSILEHQVSGNNFVMGVLLKNSSSTPYTFIKRDAKLSFTPFGDWASAANMDVAARRKVIFDVDVRITSWEDGESPALRLAPGQEKWIRLAGTMDAPKIKMFLEVKSTHASLALFRLLNYGWGSASSSPFTLFYTFGESLQQYCKQAKQCD